MNLRVLRVLRGKSQDRSRLAVLTDKGRHACALGNEIRHRAEPELFSVLSADELLQLRRLLVKLTS